MLVLQYIHFHYLRAKRTCFDGVFGLLVVYVCLFFVCVFFGLFFWLACLWMGWGFCLQWQMSTVNDTCSYHG